MKEENNNPKQYQDQVEGRNSVLELLESGKDINKIFVTKGERHGSINKIIAKAELFYERDILISPMSIDKNSIKEYQETLKLIEQFPNDMKETYE